MQGLAFRRFVQRYLVLLTLYAVLLVGTIAWFDGGGPQGWVRYAAAVLPALPIIGVVWAMGAFLTEQPDEYLRMLMTRQCLHATGFTLVVTTIWGFLEAFALAPHVPAYAVFLLFCAGQVPSALIHLVRRS